MQTAAEQGAHLLRRHRVAGIQAVDPVHTGTDPRPRGLASFGVIRSQPGMPLVGRIHGSDLPGQIVITRPGSELMQTHRHIHLKGVHAPERSRRPGVLPSVH
jgi:hypothetical protein